MAVDLTLKSTAITNREATPSVANSPGTGGAGRLKTVTGYLASVTLNLSITSVIRMVDVPSASYIKHIILQSGAQTAGKVDIGAYRNNKDGGAVVDQDFFASAVDLASAVVITDVTNESTTFTLAKQQQPLWQALGMSADPKSSLDIALTVVTTDFTTAAAPVMLEVQYVE